MEYLKIKRRGKVGKAMSSRILVIHHTAKSVTLTHDRYMKAE